MSTILDREFYTQDATTVARALLGATLVRRVEGKRVSGMIVETEAYRTREDLASHGYDAPTERSRLMWDVPGHAYIYLIYGLHWLLNVVCEPAGDPAAVLIRALEPREGRMTMALNRAARPISEWTSGPGRLTLALGIDGALNGVDVTTDAAGVWIEAGDPIPDDAVRTGPRVGLGQRVTEPWLSQPWRWWIADNPFVSR